MELKNVGSLTFKVPPEYREQVRHEVRSISFSRLKAVPWYLMLVMTLILLLGDIPKVNAALPLDHPHWLKLFVHTGFWLSSVITLLVIYLLKQKKQEDHLNSLRSFVLVFFPVACLLLAVANSLVDQLTSDSMAVYIMVSLFLALGMYPSRAFSLVLYLSGLLLFVFLLPYFQPDPAIRYHHTLVALALSGGAWYGSIIVRNVQIRQFLHLKTIEEQKESIHEQNNHLVDINEKLQRTSRRLEKVNADKNDMLRTVAHDLKNPLSGISGVMELMKLDPNMTEEEVEELHGHIHHYLKKMDKIIQNLVHRKVLDEGRMALALQPVRPSDVIREVLVVYGPVAEKKGIRMRKRKEGQQELLAKADPDAVYQILDNLVSNALKFSQPGTSLTLSVTGTADTLQLQVADEGPGMTEADQQQLFRPYAKMSARPTAGEGSTGLGLSIVKRLVHAMNGSVHVHSQEGKGTTFIVSLPRYQEQLVMKDRAN